MQCLRKVLKTRGKDDKHAKKSWNNRMIIKDIVNDRRSLSRW